MKCDIEPNPALIGSGIRFPLYVLSIVISLARPFYPNSKGFYLVNAALAVSGIALLSVGLRLVSRDELDLFHGVCLSLLLAISRPTARGSYGKGSWLTDLRFTPDGMWSLPLGLGVIGLLSGLAPLSSYALFDAVYGHPDAFGPRRDCNSQVVISMLGARVPVASPAFPWLVSIVFAAVFLSAAAMWYRYLGLVETPETVLGRVLEKLHTRVFNLPSEIDDSRLLAWFNEIQQLNWANVIPYRNIASPLGRLYLVITLEHTIWINNIDPDQRHFLLDVSWLQFVVLVITLLTLVGLVDRSPAEDDVDDGSVNLCVHLIQMTNPEPSRTATLRNFHLFDSRIVSSFLDIRTPSAGDSNYLSTSNSTEAAISMRERYWHNVEDMQMRADIILPTSEEVSLWVFSVVLDFAFNVLSGLLTAPLLKVGGNVQLSVGKLVGLGALAGTTKALLSNFSGLLCKASASNIASIVIYVASSFLIPLLTSAIISQAALDYVPESLITASLAAGAPLLLSQTMTFPNFVIIKHVYLSAPFYLLFDALGGFTFVKVAQNHGLNSGISTIQGAVVLVAFSFVTWILKLFRASLVVAVERDLILGNHFRHMRRLQERSLFGQINVASVYFPQS